MGLLFRVFQSLGESFFGYGKRDLTTGDRPYARLQRAIRHGHCDCGRGRRLDRGTRIGIAMIQKRSRSDQQQQTCHHNDLELHCQIHLSVRLVSGSTSVVFVN